MMKKLLLHTALASLILFSGISALKAQSFKMIGPKLYVFTGATAGTLAFGHNFQYVNISSDTLKVKWWEIKNTTKYTDWSDQVCDNSSCYVDQSLPRDTNGEVTAAILKSDTSAFIGDWTPKVVTTKNDTFSYVVVDIKHHSYRDTFTVVFTPVAATGIESMNYGTIQLETSPNPVTNTLRITSKNLRAGTVEIFSLAGQKLQATTVGESQYTSLNTETLNPGMYLLRYTDKSGNFGLRKFIKE